MIWLQLLSALVLLVTAGMLGRYLGIREERGRNGRLEAIRAAEAEVKAEEARSGRKGVRLRTIRVSRG